MALRCLRAARVAGGLGQGGSSSSGLGHGVSPRIVEPISVQKRFLKERNPDDSDVFGTIYQSDKYRIPHPRRLGVIPFLRPLFFGIVFGGAVVAGRRFYKNKLDPKIYDFQGFFENYNRDIEERKAIRASGWNPPSFPDRPGMYNLNLFFESPHLEFSDDPLIPSAPRLRDPGVGTRELPFGRFKPKYKDTAFLDMFFPEPYHEIFFNRETDGWDRFVTREMVSEYQADIDVLQELAASGAFPTISQEEYDRRIAAYIKQHGAPPEETLRLTVGGDPVWIDPSYTPAEVFQMAKEGKIPDAGDAPQSESSTLPDEIPPADLTQPKKAFKKKKSAGNGGNGGGSSPPPPQGEKDSKAVMEAAKPATPETPALPELPQHVTYVIIGAGTAGFSAIRGIKRNDPNARILMIGEEVHRPYMRPPLSKELWMGEKPADEGQEKADTDDGELKFLPWSGKERSIYYEKKDYFVDPSVLKENEKTAGVALLTGHKVVNLDPTRQRVTLDNGQSLSYNRCLIATGGQPVNLPAFAEASDEVKERTLVFRSIEDYKRLDELTRQGKTVAVVGGGFLGSELACALGKRAKQTGGKVVQIFPESGNMARVLPTYLSEWTTGKVRKEGVQVVTHSSVVDAKFNGSRVEISTSHDEMYEADHVVVAVGLRPNVALAKDARLELDDRKGGYLVNSELEARSNIWVAGDASCFYDTNLGRRRVEHHDHAVVSGGLAGENMTGLKKTYGHQSMFWSDLGPNVGYEAIGVCDNNLPTVAVWAKATAKDTPAAATAQAQGDKTLRSETEEQASAEEKPATKTKLVKKSKKPSKRADPSQQLVQDGEKKVNPESYGKGVIFYMRDQRVVGILMWNVFHRMPLARKIIADAEVQDDLAELAKKFRLHED